MTKIYGHRGCMGVYPENTMVGFKQAIEMGVDGLEVDVHMTKDGKMVVIHDENLERTTNGIGYIKDLTLSEINKYGLHREYERFPTYESSWTEEKVPTLKELLKLISPYQIELNIELKTSLFTYHGIEEELLSLIHTYEHKEQVIYSSFHLPTLLRLKKLDPNVKIALLTAYPLSHPGEYLEELELNSIHLSRKVFFQSSVYWKEWAPYLRIWTVNKEEEINTLLDLGVQAIITDYPQRALRRKQELLNETN